LGRRLARGGKNRERVGTVHPRDVRPVVFRGATAPRGKGLPICNQVVGQQGRKKEEKEYKRVKLWRDTGREKQTLQEEKSASAEKVGLIAG